MDEKVNQEYGRETKHESHVEFLAHGIEGMLKYLYLELGDVSHTSLPSSDGCGEEKTKRNRKPETHKRSLHFLKPCSKLRC